MNNELQSAILKLIEKSIDHGTSFLETQMPDVISQILTYNFAMSFLGSVLSVIWLGLTIAFTKKAIKRAQSMVNGSTEEALICVLIFINWLACLVFLIISLCHLDWVQIWLAPKLYLIEYARGF